jgi:hypothetical protein
MASKLGDVHIRNPASTHRRPLSLTYMLGNLPSTAS